MAMQPVTSAMTAAVVTKVHELPARINCVIAFFL
jgi:hypothetical protein